MSIQQIVVTARTLWNRKPAREKAIAKVMFGLAALAAGNSGYQLMVTFMMNIAPALPIQGTA